MCSEFATKCAVDDAEHAKQVADFFDQMEVHPPYVGHTLEVCFLEVWEIGKCDFGKI